MEALVALGHLQTSRGSADAAIAAYELVTKKNPRDVRPYFLLGLLYQGKQAFERAEEYYRKALEVKQDYAPAANNLAYLLLTNNGNKDLALSLAQAAVRGMPESPEAADTLGWAYYQKGSFSFAAEQLERAVRGMPKNATYHYHLGVVYSAADELEKARIHLQKALELAPNHPKRNEIRRLLSLS
jgi:Flp pilus assembly protein TadD